MKRMLLFFMLLASSVKGDVIKLTADYWCPFNCYPQAENPGYIIEIAKYAFEKAGHTIDYEIVPWTRAVLGAREGTYNGVVGAAHHDAPDFVFPEVYEGIALNVFWVLKDSTWEYKGIASLQEIILGAILGYAYVEPIDTYLSENRSNPKRVRMFPGESAREAATNALLNKEIGAFIEDLSVMSYFLKITGQQNLFKPASGDSLSSEKLYIAFSPNNPKSKEYAELITNAMKDLKQSGKLKEILAKYGLEPWW